MGDDTAALTLHERDCRIYRQLTIADCDCAGAEILAAREAAAEQRGREDNADHDMCYVHGSKALEARLREERVAALRETVEAHAETFGVACSTSRMWLRDRAAREAQP